MPKNAMIKNHRRRHLRALLATMLVLALVMPIITSAYAKNDTVYYLGQGTKTKKDSAYNKDEKMGANDIHAGWDLGKFCISDFSGKPVQHSEGLIFLKNVGDEISVSFLLEQKITELNGQDKLFIAEDKKAYDEYFDIAKADATNFGHGTLHVKVTDFRNHTAYQHYTDYLAGVARGANTKILTFEEGDYEIALDYQIGKNNLTAFGLNAVPTYSNYQIKIKFSVRNGNCMVYPFDVDTKTELVNTSFTENGFYLDMARSRYLDINVEKQNYIASDNTFETDTRFNRVATDGEKFTDPGIYIITVHNDYTKGNDTVKKIYVGSDPILKAYVTTGEDISFIKEAVANGATIADDGSLVYPEDEPETETDQQFLIPSDQPLVKQETKMPMIMIPIGAVIIVGIVLVAVGASKKKKEKNFANPEEDFSINHTNAVDTEDNQE